MLSRKSLNVVDYLGKVNRKICSSRYSDNKRKKRMQTAFLLFAVQILIFNSAMPAEPAKGPLRIHPENPRYFTDGSGKAVFLTGSHTWANFQERGVEGKTPDFDYERYLDFMQTMGHNFMRMWRWEHAQWMQFVPGEILIRYKPMAYMRTASKADCFSR